MRFVGQAFEIPVAIEQAALGGLTAGDMAERFTAAHRRVYLHGGEPGRKAEIVSLRYSVRRRLDALPEVREREGAERSGSVPIRAADGRTLDARLVPAAHFAGSLAGPALIEGYSSTAWVPEGWTARRDEAGNLILRRDA